MLSNDLSIYIYIYIYHRTSPCKSNNYHLQPYKKPSKSSLSSPKINNLPRLPSFPFPFRHVKKKHNRHGKSGDHSPSPRDACCDVKVGIGWCGRAGTFHSGTGSKVLPSVTKNWRNEKYGATNPPKTKKTKRMKKQEKKQYKN